MIPRRAHHDAQEAIRRLGEGEHLDDLPDASGAALAREDEWPANEIDIARRDLAIRARPLNTRFTLRKRGGGARA